LKPNMRSPSKLPSDLASRASLITSISKTVFLHLHEEAAETVSS
jgi:hypothetical protein